MSYPLNLIVLRRHNVNFCKNGCKLHKNFI
nr:MAG TPA_asm: hypothetical protein [Bacteriophage sp.]